MNLLIVLGNTRLKFALADGRRVQRVRAFPHAEVDFVEQLAAWVEVTAIPDSLWLASVARPELTTLVLDVFERAGHTVQRIVTREQALGLRVAYAQVERLGVDRWLGLLTLHAEQHAPCVVASVGSALTIDALAPGGDHRGGLIAPTPEAMRDALYARAPQLDRSHGEVSWFARSTEDCIESGSVLGGIALIERSRQMLADELGQPVRLVVSGGGADALRPWLAPHEFRPDLVLEGMACWADAVEGGLV